MIIVLTSKLFLLNIGIPLLLMLIMGRIWRI